MKRIRLVAEARTEFLRETAYYEKVRKGTGRKFRQSIEEAFARTVAFPKSGVLSAVDTRRTIVKNFPFSVVYRDTENEIVVFAIAHEKRQPEYWLSRTESDG